jgi:hypothetical protein
VLRHEVDEEFRSLQSQMKQTIHDLLSMHLKAVHPYKGEVFISKLLTEKTSGEVEQ